MMTWTIPAAKKHSIPAGSIPEPEAGQHAVPGSMPGCGPRAGAGRLF